LNIYLHGVLAGAAFLTLAGTPEPAGDTASPPFNVDDSVLTPIAKPMVPVPQVHRRVASASGRRFASH
jgi:hypothetical protein